MKRLVLMAALAATPSLAASTSEVLVTTAGVQMPAINQRLGVEIWNYGPNPLRCSFGTAITGNAFWVINALSGTTPGYWSAGARTYHAIFCAAATADQVSGAATIVNQLDGPL